MHTGMSEEEIIISDKRKRDEADLSNSNASSEEISLKRIKEELSMSNSINESLINSQPSATSTPVIPATKIDKCPSPSISKAMAGQVVIDINDLRVMIDDVITTRLADLKLIIVDEISKKMSAKYDSEINELKGNVFDLKQQRDDLNARVMKLESEISVQKDGKTRSILNDQYARRNHMVIYGLPEVGDENCVLASSTFIKDKIKVNMEVRDIEVAHRLGSKGEPGSKARPMVVVFRYRDKKLQVMRARKVLKGTGIVCSEDLCKEMRNLLKTAQKHDLVDSAWAWNGKIFVKDKSGSTVSVRYGDDWKKTLKSAGAKQSSHNTGPVGTPAVSPPATGATAPAASSAASPKPEILLA